MKMQTDWPILKRIAQRSPKKYAEQIWQRNMELLDGLYKLSEINRAGTHEHLVGIGCPHCVTLCSGCLWETQASKNQRYEWTGHFFCGQAHFAGVTLNRVSSCFPNRRFLIEYGQDGADVKMTSEAARIIPEERRRLECYKECEAFLRAHIQWAEKPYWGELL